MLSEKSRVTLIEIARAALSGSIRKVDYEPEDPGLEELSARCGCFVTFKTKGELRGCMGCFTSNDPLYLTVANYAKLSATEDPRFIANRISEQDLDKIDMDISVLSPLKPCDNPEGIRLGVDGIYLRKGFSSGCFLPQVATETGWSVEQFWSYCCSHKAGLRADAWKSGDVELFTFTAEVIDSPAKGK